MEPQTWTSLRKQLMAIVFNFAYANCFNQRTQLQAGCIHLHSIQQSEDITLWKASGCNGWASQ